MTSTPSPRPAKRSRRADAQHNYDRLVAVARAATEHRGERISLEDVARDAGVAIGTLYNHFPTRQDLLAATFIDETEALRARAVELTNHPAPGDALREWLHLHLQYSARGRGLGALVMSWKYVEGSEMQIAFHAMREAGEQLFDQAVDNGDVRSDIELIDLLRLIWGTELISSQASAPPERVNAMFDIVLAGSRPTDESYPKSRNQGPVPAPARSSADADVAFAGRLRRVRDLPHDRPPASPGGQGTTGPRGELLEPSAAPDVP